jgi:alkanesulfonate monooxygenase SsuD/methylene tetrahydromethanopterin reductase-like flavin-dependent oxidoreductase (luciferase family)
MELSLRYDLRAPAFGPASASELYEAALAQAAWADGLGFDRVYLTGHHGSEDGYCPSPVVVGAAIAARTTRIRVQPVLILPFYEPIKLAEDLAVLDLLSQGRLGLTLVAGYVGEEFARFGVDLADRPELMEAGIRVLRAAWSGEPFEYRGRTVHVTPAPHQPGGPKITMGGSAAPAARRAARIADEFRPTAPDLWSVYVDACADAGRDPGPPPPTRSPSFIHITEDPDEAWKQIAPYALHETNSYGRWIAEAGTKAPYTPAADAEELRARGMYRVVTPDECVELAHDFELFELHPLMGGLPPDLSWESLHLFETRVLPELRAGR